ncbi:DUF1566 domain-containing protein [Rhabdochromatium marinum]|uniref:DUF1566 domain-containing protein n=1 Tax=Rhabdochromatium marinum TaxID=48729 RepID=UPI0019058ECB|nr:DUF1566 domain-containing protein [Rhabdochromatium marinum]MBK1647788.1 hypothetical protein [Rhabdochromatium marinum]
MPFHLRLTTAALVLPAAWLVASTAFAASLNDTGIVRCGDAGSNNVDCPVAGYSGQDAEYGRDATNDDPIDGHAGFSFTKLDANGADLPATATAWNCVRDNVTGLIWEVKTDDGGLRDRDWNYSWYNPDPTSNGGNTGTQNSGVCEGSDCDTQGFVNAVNAQGLCGASDWRLPKREELRSILSYDRYSPSIDDSYFPNTSFSSVPLFWSASPDAYDSDYAWFLAFDLGYDGYDTKDHGNHVRLVRGGQTTPLGSYQAVGNQVCNDAIPATAPDGRYVINDNGTVTDGITGLMWKRCAEGLSGTDCSSGTAATYTWQQALELAPLSNFAGYTDWRLPNLKELSSLVEMRCHNPAINGNSFPNTPSAWFWSASPDAYNSDYAWYLFFGSGGDGDYPKFGNPYVRLVRDRQVYSLLSLSVNGSGTVTSTDNQITCPGDCLARYIEATSVILTAIPDSGWQFNGWGGACTGIADCFLTVDSTLSVTANFTEADPAVTTTYLSLDDDQLELTGIANTTTRYLDFGGQDTYTLSPNLAGSIKLIDNQATTVILPSGLAIDAVAFVSDGLRFTINGYLVTLLGAVSNFSFTFGGDTGVMRGYAETATAFGASIPVAGASPVFGSITGTIGSDGSIVP